MDLNKEYKLTDFSDVIFNDDCVELSVIRLLILYYFVEGEAAKMKRLGKGVVAFRRGA